MIKKDKQYTIYIRSTKESIPVNKEEFDAYYSRTMIPLSLSASMRKRDSPAPKQKADRSL